MREIRGLLFLLMLTACVAAKAARSSEAVSGSRGSKTNTVNAGGDCTSPFCLPKDIVDDDPTLGAKLPDCGILGPMMSSSQTLVASADGESDGLKCSSNPYNKPTDSEKAQQARLYKCLEQVRTILPSDYQAQKKFISGLQSARLKTFLGMVLTTYGETDAAMAVEDHLAIMKVLDNRTRTCVNDDKPSATTWEIATSRNQFSMYNASLYGGKDKDFHIKNKEKNESRMKLAMEAFTKLQCAKMEPEAQWEKAEHYKADYVSPDWAKGKDLIISAKINGDAIANKRPYHQFYQLPWSCVIGSGTKGGKNKKRAAIDTGYPYVAWLSFVSSVAQATDAQSWEIVDFGKRGFYLRLKNRILTQTKIQSDPLGAKLLSVVSHKRHKFIDIIRYDAGEHGTSQIVRIHRAVLFDTRSGEILGDFPVQYSVAGAKVQPAQPKWTDTKTEISIYDPETDETETLDLSQ